MESLIELSDNCDENRFLSNCREENEWNARNDLSLESPFRNKSEPFNRNLKITACEVINKDCNDCPVGVLVDLPSSSSLIGVDISTEPVEDVFPPMHRENEDFGLSASVYSKSENSRLCWKTPSPQSMAQINIEASKVIKHLNSSHFEDIPLSEEKCPLLISYDSNDSDTCGENDDSILKQIIKTENTDAKLSKESHARKIKNTAIYPQNLHSAHSEEKEKVICVTDDVFYDTVKDRKNKESMNRRNTLAGTNNLLCKIKPFANKYADSHASSKFDKTCQIIKKSSTEEIQILKTPMKVPVSSKNSVVYGSGLIQSLKKDSIQVSRNDMDVLQVNKRKSHIPTTPLRRYSMYTPTLNQIPKSVTRTCTVSHPPPLGCEKKLPNTFRQERSYQSSTSRVVKSVNATTNKNTSMKRMQKKPQFHTPLVSKVPKTSLTSNRLRSEFSMLPLKRTKSDPLAKALFTEVDTNNS